MKKNRAERNYETDIKAQNENNIKVQISNYDVLMRKNNEYQRRVANEGAENRKGAHSPTKKMSYNYS